MALHLSMPISNSSLTQQGDACYVIKLKCTSFELRSKLGVAFAQGKAAQSQSQSQGARGGPTPGDFS